MAHMNVHVPAKRPAMKRLSILVAAMALACAGAAHAQRAYVPIEQRLSAEQMHATGLDALDAEQLALLNRLLSEEQTAVIQQTARERKPVPEGPVHSSIKGEFRGWETGTVFELANGERWRVVDGEYYAGKGLANPTVTVKPGAFGSWYLQVEGVSIGAKVKRVEP